MGVAYPAPAAGRESLGRTILIIDEQPYLWAVLRQRVELRTAYVRGVTPAQLPGVWRTCRPWPWLVVGATPGLPDGLVDLLGDHPIPVYWLGEPPPGLPGRPLVHADWMALAGDLERLNGLGVTGFGGVRLLRNRGLLAPGGRMVLGAAHLEGLLAAPDGLVMPPGAGKRAAEAIQAEIDGHDLPLRLDRAGDLLRLA
ncbi:MAG TPA: hypothetical protein VKF59_13965 [Candidatus Dormibacteraeota bacterium]|nr:hypothetical protein [Candidatus Dormibacteraeota bacterium]